MRILGIDPGSVTTGFGVVDYDRGRLTLVAQGSINTRRGAELAERLRKIHDDLERVIQQHAPQAMAVETPFAGQNVKSLIQLAHARGVVLRNRLLRRPTEFRPNLMSHGRRIPSDARDSLR